MVCREGCFSTSHTILEPESGSCHLMKLIGQRLRTDIEDTPVHTVLKGGSDKSMEDRSINDC